MLSEVLDGVLLAARFLLSALFLVAGIAKLTTLKSVQQAIAEFGVPLLVVRPVSIFIASAEVAAALALVYSPTAVAGAWAIVLLLALFSVFIGLALARGRQPECNCFGQISSSNIGPGSIARNLALMAIAILVAWRTGMARPVTGSMVGVAIISMVLTAFLCGQVWMMFHLLRQNGRILNRLERLEEDSSRDVPRDISAVRSTSADSPFRFTRSEAAT